MEAALLRSSVLVRMPARSAVGAGGAPPVPLCVAAGLEGRSALAVNAVSPWAEFLLAASLTAQ